jgi:hypothetical protein
MRCRGRLIGPKRQHASSFPGARRKTGAIVVSILGVLLCAALTVPAGDTMAAPKTRQIQAEYMAPTDSAYQGMVDTLKNARVLEYVQEVLGVIRLPRPLAVKLASCDGESNAWFDGDQITVCYEYVADIYKNAAEGDFPIGISRLDTIIGPLLDVFLHEAGHAVFNYLKVPIFGREEDAADQFSTIIMLQYDKERARRLILGSAYQYKMAVKEPKLALNVTKFADEHGLPAQRFFNVLCVAYGFDPKLFADVVDRKYLPEDRAAGCEDEYRQVERAFRTLISPHINRAAAKKALKRRHKTSGSL